MSRRSPGEGSISQRKDGRWQASLQINGQRTTVYGKTRAVAAAKLRELQRQAPARDVNLTLSRYTVNDLLDAWLEVVAPNLRPATTAQYTLECNRHIRPALGSLRLAAITPDKLQRLYASIRGAGLGRTAELVHALLHQAFGYAVLWRWLPENPCERVVRPTHRAERKALWTTDELKLFLDGTSHHWLYPLWLVLAYSGCRLGELLALEWEDVDFDLCTIAITKTLQRVNGEWQICEPKTRAGIRVISLPALAMEALRKQAPEGAMNRADLVFTRGYGPVHRSTVSHAMRRECDRLELPRLTPHGLRHLHASVLLDERVPIPAVSERLGHASPTITMAVYAHAVRRDDSRTTAAIERGLA